MTLFGDFWSQLEYDSLIEESLGVASSSLSIMILSSKIWKLTNSSNGLPFRAFLSTNTSDSFDSFPCLNFYDSYLILRGLTGNSNSHSFCVFIFETKLEVNVGNSFLSFVVSRGAFSRLSLSNEESLLSNFSPWSMSIAFANLFSRDLPIWAPILLLIFAKCVKSFAGLYDSSTVLLLSMMPCWSTKVFPCFTPLWSLPPGFSTLLRPYLRDYNLPASLACPGIRPFPAAGERLGRPGVLWYNWLWLLRCFILELGLILFIIKYRIYRFHLF